MRRMAEMNPNARHVLVPDAGHLVHDDQPLAYRTEVSAFLRSVLG